MTRFRAAAFALPWVAPVAQTPTAVTINPRDPNPATAPERSWAGHMANEIGSTYGPEPLAVLRASTSALRIVGNLGDFTIPLAQVRKLGRGRLYPWFFGGIRIEHECPGVPPKLQFKPMASSTAELLEALRQFGFPAP